MSRITARAVMGMKGKKQIAALTAADTPTARCLDQAGVDLILVGDSLVMVELGMKDTLSATMEIMLHHTAAVSRGVEHALVIADMPFLSYQLSPQQACENAGRFLVEGGAQAVKIEGGLPMAETVRFLTDRGIPVLAHIGLTPQSVHQLGGYRVQGRTEETATLLKEGALAVQAAGAFAIVLEAIPSALAGEITRSLDIPTIGIGAGPECDGHILVVHDLVGLAEDHKPKFVRRYAEIGGVIRGAASQYVQDIRDKKYPSAEESYE